MSPNTGEGYHEAANENNKPQKKDTENLQTKLYNDFVSTKILSDRVAFVNQYMKMDPSEAVYRDEVMKFANSHDAYDEIDSDFRDKISLEKIQRKITPELTKINISRTNFRSLFLKQYDMSTTQYNKTILPIIEKLDPKNLSQYMTSMERMKDFFLEYSLEEPPQKSFKNILETFDYKTKIQSLSPEKQEMIREKVEEDLQGISIYSPLFAEKLDTAIQALVSVGIFSVAEKKDLIESFIPNITLKKAQQLGLLKESEIEDFLEEEFLTGIDRAFHKDVLKKLKSELGSIEFPISEIKKISDKQADSILRQADFRRIAHEIQDFHKYGKQGSIATFEELQEGLTEFSQKIKGISEISPGKILQLEVKRGSVISEEYYEILSVGTGDGMQDQIVLQNKGGNGRYNPEGKKIDYFSYGDFLKKLQSKAIDSGKVVSKEFFDDQVAKGEIDQIEGNYTYTLDRDKGNRQKIEKEKFAQKLYDAKKTETLLTEDELDEYIQNMSKEDKKLYENDLLMIDEGGDHNIMNLRSQIDKIDSKGSIYGLAVGTTMFDSKSGDSYTILEINPDTLPKGKIVVMGIGTGKEETNFEDFFEVFSERKMQRTAKVFGGDDLQVDVNTQEGIWSDQISIKNGVFHNEAYSDPKHKKCEYLAADDIKNPFWKDYTALKVHNISGDTAEVSLGKVKKIQKSEKKDIPDDTEYSIARDKILIPLGVLSTWIKNSKLQAKSLGGENAIEKDEVEKDSRKGNLMGWYFANFLSLSSVVSGGKMWVDNMKDYFEKGTDEQATRFLSKLPVFTDEQKAAMKMRIEQAEKKQTDEFLELLKVLDSGPATEMIERWILDKYSEEGKRIAALLFMFEKYGVLYEKKALIKHKGDFIWYQAFGGRKGDKFYQEYKQKCLDDDQHFTEEGLMYDYIAQRCKGYIKPPLRGKLYKEIEAIMGKGLTDEMEKGKGDADKKGSYAAKEGFALGELKDGGFPNAMGAFESMINKGSSGGLPRLNMLPFVMLTSGEAKSFPAALTNKFKSNNFVFSSFYTHAESHVDLYNRVVVKLSQDIEDKIGGKYKGMSSEANTLINGMSGETSDKRVAAAVRFYEKYEDVLGRALLRLNSRKQDAEAEFETWIEDHSESDSDYKQYNQLFGVAFTAIKDSEFGKTDILKDAYASDSTPGTGGLTGYDVEEFSKKFLLPNNGGVGFRDQDLGEMYWKEITGQIDSLATNKNISEEYKRKRMGSIIAGLMDGLSASYAQRNDEVDKILSNPAATFYTRFHEWGVKQEDFYLGGGKFADSFKGQKVIDKYIDRILNSRGRTSYEADFSLKNIEEIQESVGAGVADNLNHIPD